VYAGWINKNIVSKLNSLGTMAVGLCGADACLVPAKKRIKGTVDYGFVGDVSSDKINTKFLKVMIDQHITPVIAPITSTKQGQLLNTNADTIAAILASSLSKLYKVKFIYCFEKDGVLNNNKVIAELNKRTFEELKQKEIIHTGMIPKLENAFEAFSKGTHVTIGNAAHLQKLIKQHAGTAITK
jgi:acetylglutamate kinase